MSKPHILTKELTKVFETADGVVEAVKKVDLEVGWGEFVSIIGPTGSGKTTLLNLIGGLTTPSEGLVFIGELHLGSLSDQALSRLRGEKVGFIYQFPSLIPSLTVQENAALPALLLGKEPRKAAIKRAEEILALVGMEAKKDSYPSQLSGGEQRKAAIARAFINEPELILADEPTGDLDEGTEHEMIELFHRLNREERITFILVTHNTQLAVRGDRLLRMRGGVLIQSSPITQKKRHSNLVK